MFSLGRLGINNLSQTIDFCIAFVIVARLVERSPVNHYDIIRCQYILGIVQEIAVDQSSLGIPL